MQSKRKYSVEQKKQLLANLDLEVEHRTRQFEEWLADALENFKRHHEGVISRIPRLVRDMTLKEFAKYNGNVQEAAKGLKKDLLGAEEPTIDKSTRKRKWIVSQDSTDKLDAKATHDGGESSRGVKNARTMPTTPRKGPGPSSGTGPSQKPRFPLSKTPSTLRTIQRVPSGTHTPNRAASTKPPFSFRPPSRPASPSKLPSPTKATSRPVRPPSSSLFDPSLPAHQPRWPRNNEAMLSINGSPLANPLQLGFVGYLRASEGETESDVETDRSGKVSRKGSSIVVHSSAGNGHSRSNSQTSVITNGHSHGGHSRTNSQNGFVPTRNNGATTEVPSAPAPIFSLSSLVSVPTKDGHVLEFDPLRTSPEELDALEGISDSAKKQAKLDMARLIQATFDRWKIS